MIATLASCERCAYTLCAYVRMLWYCARVYFCQPMIVGDILRVRTSTAKYAKRDVLLLPFRPQHVPSTAHARCEYDKMLSFPSLHLHDFLETSTNVGTINILFPPSLKGLERNVPGPPFFTYQGPVDHLGNKVLTRWLSLGL